MEKSKLKGYVGLVLASTLLFSSAVTNAGYLSSQDFTLLSSAWNPGADTSRNIVPFTPPVPGGATWSLMGAGIVDVSGRDPHGGSATTAFTALLGQTQAQAIAYVDDILDVWALQSGFTNLGHVADGGVGFGASNASGGNLGDIRIGAVNIDGARGVLAHAFNPCIQGFCGSTGSIGGDLHIDNSETWVDGAGADFDLYTVLLHEFGHALGLGHSNIAGSIMQASYMGVQRTLHADDLAGIQAIYGVSAVPLPAGIVLLLTGLFSLGLVGNRKKAQS